MSVLISFSIPFIFPKNMFNEPLKMGRDGHAWQWGHVSGVVEMKVRTHSVNVFFQKKKKNSEHLLRTRYCTRFWGYSQEETRCGSYLLALRAMGGWGPDHKLTQTLR